jgi:Kef-type K+ transport system membrane component KefB
MLFILAVFAVCLAVTALVGALLGILVRRLARDCAKREYVRDTCTGFAVPLFVYSAPIVGFVLYVSQTALHVLAISDTIAIAVAAVLAIICSSVGVWVQLMTAGIGRRERRGQCHACGYDLRHSHGPCCPECGARTDPHSRSRAILKR